MKIIELLKESADEDAMTIQQTAWSAAGLRGSELIGRTAYAGGELEGNDATGYDMSTDGHYVKITSETAKKRWKGNFSCSFLGLTTLVDAPEVIDGNLNCSSNKLRSLKDIHKIFKEINGKMIFIENPIKSHVLGVLYIKGVESLTLTYTQRSDKRHDDLRKVQDIINKYLKEPYGHKRVFDCQCELQDADLDEYAKL